MYDKEEIAGSSVSLTLENPMLGDAARLLNQVTSKANLQQAFGYALRARKKEWFYDPFELEWAEQNEAVIVDELADELKDPLNYQLKPAYAYFTQIGRAHV